MQVSAPAYETLTIEWTNPDNNTYQSAQLRRSTTGIPVDTDDGTLLATYTSGTPTATYTDTGLTPQSWYYYALFTTSDGTNWYLIDSGFALSIGNQGSYTSLLAKIPEFFKTVQVPTGNVGGAQLLGSTPVPPITGSLAVPLTAGTLYTTLTLTTTPGDVYEGSSVMLSSGSHVQFFTVPSTTSGTSINIEGDVANFSYPVNSVVTILPTNLNQDLANFLKVLGWGVDIAKSDTDEVLHAYDPHLVDQTSLKYLAKTLGVRYENSVPTAFMRKRIANAGVINQIRGTYLGITDSVEATFGYEVTLTESPNFFPNGDVASFNSPNYPLWDPATYYKTGDVVFQADPSRTDTSSGSNLPYQSQLWVATSPSYDNSPHVNAPNTWSAYTASLGAGTGNVSGWGEYSFNPAALPAGNSEYWKFTATHIDEYIGNTSRTGYQEDTGQYNVLRVQAGSSTNADRLYPIQPLENVDNYLTTAVYPTSRDVTSQAPVMPIINPYDASGNTTYFPGQLVYGSDGLVYQCVSRNSGFAPGSNAWTSSTYDATNSLGAPIWEQFTTTGVSGPHTIPQVQFQYQVKLAAGTGSSIGGWIEFYDGSGNFLGIGTINSGASNVPVTTTSTWTTIYITATPPAGAVFALPCIDLSGGGYGPSSWTGMPAGSTIYIDGCEIRYVPDAYTSAAGAANYEDANGFYVNVFPNRVNRSFAPLGFWHDQAASGAVERTDQNNSGGQADYPLLSQASPSGGTGTVNVTVNSTNTLNGHNTAHYSWSSGVSNLSVWERQKAFVEPGQTYTLSYKYSTNGATLANSNAWGPAIAFYDSNDHQISSAAWFQTNSIATQPNVPTFGVLGAGVTSTPASTFYGGNGTTPAYVTTTAPPNAAYARLVICFANTDNSGFFGPGLSTPPASAVTAGADAFDITEILFESSAAPGVWFDGDTDSLEDRWLTLQISQGFGLLTYGSHHYGDDLYGGYRSSGGTSSSLAYAGYSGQWEDLNVRASALIRFINNELPYGSRLIQAYFNAAPSTIGLYG